MLADGFREGDYVFERIVVEPGTIIHKGEKDKMDGVFNGIWRWRPLSKERIEGFAEEVVMQSGDDVEEEATYRAIRVLVIEGTKEFVRETLKRSVIDAEIATAFIEQGGTVSYRSTKLEKVLEIEEAELGE